MKKIRQQNRIPKGWKEIEFGNTEIFELKKGSSITKSKITEGNIPVIAGGQKLAYYHNKSNRTGETITISASGAYAGFINYFNQPIFASDCSTIQIKDKKKVLMKYVFYFLKSNQEKIYKLQRGIAQPHVYSKDVAKIKIPLPPLSVQKKIVSILEKAEKLKQEREKSDELTQEYIQSIFYKMLANEKKIQIKELKDFIEELRYGSSMKSGDKGHPILGIPNVLKEELIINTNNKVDITQKEFEKYRLKKFDILFVRTNGNPNYIGRCGIFNANYDNYVFASYLIRARINRKMLNPYFLKAYLESPTGRKELLSKCRTTAGQYNINTEGLRSIKIPDLNINIQNKFAKIVEEVEKLKQKQKQSKEEINQMFNNLMQKAFKGELVC